MDQNGDWTFCDRQAYWPPRGMLATLLTLGGIVVDIWAFVNPNNIYDHNYKITNVLSEIIDLNDDTKSQRGNTHIFQDKYVSSAPYSIIMNIVISFSIFVLMLWKGAMGHFRFQNQIYDNEEEENSKLNSLSQWSVDVT